MAPAQSEVLALDCGVKAMSVTANACQATLEAAMLQGQRSRKVRLEIELEADALLSISGAKAYSIALKRSEEASSHVIARDWIVVAAAVARKSGARSSLLDALLG
jgi:hypothetical protein